MTGLIGLALLFLFSSTTWKTSPATSSTGGGWCTCGAEGVWELIMGADPRSRAGEDHWVDREVIESST